MIGARVRYFLTDAWDEFKHSPGANLLAAATLTAVLLLAASLLLVLRNAERQVQRVRGEARSEERRVGKECTIQCRSRWSPYH